jgi:hypothetical protein
MLQVRVRLRTKVERVHLGRRFSFVLIMRFGLPGNAHLCRMKARICKALARRAWRPEVSQSYSELAEIWNRLAAETEADNTLYRALAEIELGEPYEVLPLALNLRSWPA